MSIEEDIKILRKMQKCLDIKAPNINVRNADTLKYQAIENVLKELERLTYARNWYFEHTTAQIATPEQLHKILSFDYVSKDKIREEIKELEELIEKCIEDEEHYGEIPLYEHDIKLLQELLEE